MRVVREHGADGDVGSSNCMDESSRAECKYHIFGREAQAIQCAGHMQVAGHAGASVHILTNALQSRCLGAVSTEYLQGRSETDNRMAEYLGEIGGADALAHNVVCRAAGDVVDFLRLHEVQQLRPDFAHLDHGLGVDKVVLAPARAVAGVLPKIVDVHQC